MPIMEDRSQERVVRDYPRADYPDDYLIRDRDYRAPRGGTGPRALAMAGASSGAKTVGGIVVAVLAILALIGVIPRILMSIAGIVFGLVMLFEGLGITSEYRKLARWVAESGSERFEVRGGTAVEVAVGVGAIVLGILALLGVAPATLIPVLVIVGGIGLMMAVGTVHRLTDLRLTSMGASDLGRQLHQQWTAASSIMETFGGLAAIVLGILSLVWAATTASGFGTLAQIGMICLGIAAAMGAAAMAGRSTALYRRGGAATRK